MDEDAPPADLTVPFNRAWTGSREHGVLSGQLAAADPEAWVRLALPLVRAVASVPGEILSASALTAVADGFLLSVPGPGPPWFVQFLHFAEPGDRLGELHLEVCQASVRKLTESRVSASRYLLIHNSDHRNPAFRQGLETAVSEPVRAGRVERAEVWDRQRLLREAFNAMASHVLASARAGALSVASVEQALVGEPLSEVPLQQSLLTANQHKLLSEAPMGGPAVVDPAAVIFDEAKENISLLLGTFGFGKTTAIARRLRDRSSQVLFVPGGRLTGDIRSTKDFVSQCIALDSLLGDESHLDRLLLERVARPTALLLFKDESLPLVLVLDALDESAFLCRQGGLLALFNNLREVRIPVVLAMRQEFWLSRRLELEESFGMLATKTPDRISRIRAVELLPWQDDQILACLSRARELVTAEEERQRLADLARVVAEGRLDGFYGDLARRPLFLRFIVESVAEEGLPGQKVSRAQLYCDWIRRKILRDMLAPRREGGERPELLFPGEPPEQVLELAWEAMLQAAAAMACEHHGILELEAEVELESVLGASPRLQQVKDALALVLQSLLLPNGPRRGERPARVAFAHRTFQEFFFAWLLVREGGPQAPLLLPPEVEEWCEQLAQESLVAKRLGASGWRPEPSGSIQKEPRRASHHPGPSDAPDLELLIDEVPGHQHRRFRVHLSARDIKLGLNHQSLGEINFAADPAPFLTRHYRDLTGDSAATKPVGRLRLEMLRVKGAYLAEKLLPLDLRRRLASLIGRAQTLLIQSDEPWIPWELLRIGQTPESDAADGPFLAEAFRVTRWLSSIPQTVWLPVSKLALVIPRDSRLPHATSECEELLKLSQTQGRDVVRLSASLTPLRQGFREGLYDAWHFTGHGLESGGVDPDQVGLLLEEQEYLTPQELSGEGKRMGRKRPLVFFNSCDSARASWSLTEIGGWAPAFLGAGAGAFLGSYWPIRDARAGAFAQEFYRRFLAGATIADAMHQSREAIRSDDDPTWLAYTLFAHPGAVCRPRPPGPS